MKLSTKPTSVLLHLTATAEVHDDEQARTISGLAVPYGPAGRTSVGAITFSPGSLSWPEDTSRVKLLVQHDMERSIGYATALTDGDDGLHATFTVPASDLGDNALAEAADGRRDGMSIGVLLDAESVDRIWDAMLEESDEPVPCSGALIETSLVSIPAFDDARVDNAAPTADPGGPLVLAVASWATATANTRKVTMPPTPAPTGTAAAADQTPAPTTDPTTAAAPAAPAAPPAPVAGNARVVAEAPTYTFDGNGPSFVRDSWHARFGTDPDAAGRIQRFQRELASGGEVRNLMAAVLDRTDLPEVIPPGYRGDLLVNAIDKGRPLVSRIGTVSLSDATPFTIPVEGDFSGVAAHTEGDAAAADGTYSLDEVTVTPTAISGAFRVSREMVDASNPAIDQLVARGMARDYRGLTETRTVAALAAADASPTLSIDTIAELRGQIVSFTGVQDLPPDFIAASSAYYTTLTALNDSDGRPMLPFLNPTNAVGSVKAGHTGASIDGVELAIASKVTANEAWLILADDVFIGESSLQTFTFNEVEGPGIVKLALWAYFAAQVLRATSTVRITSAAS